MTPNKTYSHYQRSHLTYLYIIDLGGATFKLLAVVTYQNVVRKHTMGEISYFASVVKNKNKIIIFYSLFFSIGVDIP